MNQVGNSKISVIQTERLVQARVVLSDPGVTLVALRHAKLKMNTLLRWCSAGLIASYILAIVTGIRFCSYVFVSEYVTWLIPAILAVLLLCLLLVEYYYSEKKSDNKYIGKNYEMPTLPMIKAHLKINKQITAIYLIAVVLGWLLAIAIIFGKHGGLALIILSALILYGFGLFIIAVLLKDKSITGRIIKDMH
jgi:hypothetical protein